MRGAAVLVLLSSCSSAPTEAALPSCDAPYVAAKHGCVARFDDCPSDAVPSLGGGCSAIGVPRDACAEGFAHDGAGGCEPILPPAACAKGTYAIPGETSCHPVGTCPAAETTADLYVDGSFVGASDGSKSAPFATIGAALAVAKSGAVVAIAKGRYSEALVIARPVTLAGSCAAEVELTAAASAAIIENTSPIVVRDVSFSGAATALAEESSGSTLERVWIHDMTSTAIEAYGKLDLRDVLIESVAREGVFALGAQLTVERTVIRDVASGSDKKSGEGLRAELDVMVTKRRADVSIRRSVIERATQAGVSCLASTVRVEGSVVRETRARVSDGKVGTGVYVTSHDATMTVGEVTVTGSLIASNRRANVYALGSKVIVERSVLRDGKPREAGSGYGLGLEATYGSEVEVRDSIVKGNLYGGIHLAGSKATIERTIVRDTAPQVSDGAGGAGIVAWVDDVLGSGSDLTLRACRIERSVGTGLYVGGSIALVEGLVVEGVTARSDDLFGDGVTVTPLFGKTIHESSLTLERALIRNNARSGLFVGGGTVRMSDAELRCNRLQIVTVPVDVFTSTGEKERRAPRLEDGGHVACGCEGPLTICHASSSELLPMPPPVAER